VLTASCHYLEIPLGALIKILPAANITRIRARLEARHALHLQRLRDASHAKLPLERGGAAAAAQGARALCSDDAGSLTEPSEQQDPPMRAQGVTQRTGRQNLGSSAQPEAAGAPSASALLSPPSDTRALSAVQVEGGAAVAAGVRGGSMRSSKPETSGAVEAAAAADNLTRWKKMTPVEGVGTDGKAGGGGLSGGGGGTLTRDDLRESQRPDRAAYAEIQEAYEQESARQARKSET
jgi:hypothetical protein